jgi:hypothetical protein
MFVMHMPLSFKIGDTANVNINREPTTLTWRDVSTLVIGSDDARRIVQSGDDDGLRCFVCTDADGDDDFVIIR